MRARAFHVPPPSSHRLDKNFLLLGAGLRLAPRRTAVADRAAGPRNTACDYLQLKCWEECGRPDIYVFDCETDGTTFFLPIEEQTLTSCRVRCALASLAFENGQNKIVAKFDTRARPAVLRRSLLSLAAVNSEHADGTHSPTTVFCLRDAITLQQRKPSIFATPNRSNQQICQSNNPSFVQTGSF